MKKILFWILGEKVPSACRKLAILTGHTKTFHVIAQKSLRLGARRG